MQMRLAVSQQDATGRHMASQAAEASDETLAAAVRRGDQRAFATLLDRHYDKAHRVASRVLADCAAAEDVVQEAMLKFWQQPDRFDAARGRFSPWLMRVVVNRALDRRRALRPVSDIDEMAGLHSDDAGPEDLAMADGARRHIDAAMQQLPPRQRAALALFYAEGYTMAEVATLMETNAKAVESLLSRGRAALRGLLQPVREVL